MRIRSGAQQSSRQVFGHLLGVFPWMLAMLGCGDREPCPPTPSSGALARLDTALETCNNRPLAVLDGSPTYGKGDEAVFFGNRSSDPDLDRIELFWDVLPPPGRTASMIPLPGSRARLVHDGEGMYEIILVASDGELDSRPVTLVTRIENRPPTAVAGESFSALLGSTVTLDGSASSDPDGDPLTFEWTLESQPTASVAVLTDAFTVQPTIVPDVAGRYDIQLVVSDGTARSAPATIQVCGGCTGGPPTARAGSDARVPLNAPHILDGSGSSDPDGDALRYAWTVEESPPGASYTLNDSDREQAIFIPRTEGSYTIQLVVDDEIFESPPARIRLEAAEDAQPGLPDRLDPGAIYMMGSLEEGVRCDAEAIGSLGVVPGIIPLAVGFDCKDFQRQGAIRADGRFIYLVTSFGRGGAPFGGLREFRSDPPPIAGSGYPQNPEQNDPPITIPGCPVGRQVGRTMAAGDTVWVACEDDRRFHGSDGSVMDREFLARAQGFYLAEATLHRASDDAPIPMDPPLPLPGLIAAARATPTGFLAALQANDGLGIRDLLFRIQFDGTTEEIGRYDARANLYLFDDSVRDRVRLEADGSLIKMFTIRESLPGSEEEVVRFGPDGTTEVIYSETRDMPFFRLYSTSTLVGGRAGE